MNNLAELVHSKLETISASLCSTPLTQSSSQIRLEPDVRKPQPGVTAGHCRMFQALGVPDRTSAVPLSANPPVGQGIRAPSVEQLGSASAPHPQSAPDAAPPPPRYEVPLSQPSTSGWVPSGLPRSARDARSSSESEASDVESDSSVRDSASARLVDLIYEVCPNSRPVADGARPPCCDFEAWFGQPEASASMQRFCLYPRVAEVESEVVARTETLARRTKPLSHILPSRSRRYAVAHDPLFVSSLPVNPLFAQLAGTKAVGNRRWGSVSFSEIERIEHLFRTQLEMTSSSLWLMSGILAMLKRDGF